MSERKDFPRDLFVKVVDIIRELEKVSGQQFDLESSFQMIGQQSPSWFDTFSRAELLMFCVGSWYFWLTQGDEDNDPLSLKKVPDWVKWWCEAENEWEQ